MEGAIERGKGGRVGERQRQRERERERMRENTYVLINISELEKDLVFIHV